MDKISSALQAYNRLTNAADLADALRLLQVADDLEAALSGRTDILPGSSSEAFVIDRMRDARSRAKSIIIHFI